MELNKSAPCGVNVKPNEPSNRSGLRRRFRSILIPVLLSALCALLQSFAIFDNSYVFNEHARLTAGLAKLKYGDFPSFA